MRSIYLILLQFLYALWSLFYISGNKEFMLNDGLSVLQYVCTESWKTSRGSPFFIINFISNGIYSYVYPKWMHCGLEPPFFIVFLLNQIFLTLTILITCKFVKDNFSRLILLSSVIYGSFTSGIASKEAFLGFIFTLLALYIRNILKNQDKNISKISFWFPFITIIILNLVLSLSRLTYIIIIFPLISSIFTIQRIRSIQSEIFNKVLLIFLLLMPILITTSFVTFILNLSDLPFSSIFLDYLNRFQAVGGGDNLENIDYLRSSFTLQGSIYKILVTAFGYRHLLMALGGENVPLIISFFCTKLSVTFVILKSYYFIFKNQFFSFNKNRKATKNIYISLFLAANLASVFIYPFAHERYFLPSTSFALILLASSNSIRKNTKKILN